MEPRDYIVLLQGALTVFIEITEFFTSKDERRAINARDKLDRRRPGAGSFYSELLVDLTEFLSTVEGIQDNAQDVDETDFESVIEILRVLDVRFVQPSEDEREAFAYPVLEDGEFVGLEFLLWMLQDPGAKPEETRKLDWLCSHLRIEYPREAARTEITAAVQAGQGALSKYASLPSDEHALTAGDQRQSEWDGAKPFYANLKRLHEDLETCWSCKCEVPHKMAKFSFDYLPDRIDGQVDCLLCYPHDRYERDSFVWQPVRMQYQEYEDEQNMLTPIVRPGKLRYLRPTIPGRAPSSLCEMLQASQDGNFVRLVARRPRLDSGHSQRRRSVSLHEPTYLLEWLRHSTPVRFKEISKRFRFALALRLAYDYLFLSGGPWWPYDRVSDDRAFSVCFFDVDSDPEDAIQRPFFTSSLPDQTNAAEVPHVLKLINEYMPSLPVFGKLLLEVVTGRYVDWKDLDSALETYSKKMHGMEIASAVKACLGMGNDYTFRTGGLISQDKRLRTYFLTEVVLKIQHVVHEGYGMTVEDIFGMSDGDRLSDTKSSPSRSPRRTSTPRLSPSPKIEDTFARQLHSSGYCLHDGKGLETLDVEEAEEAVAWMENLQTCTARVFPATCRMRRVVEQTPIKIAIIDTGAHILEDTLSTLYDGRLKESRSWLHSWNDEGDLIEDGSDEDGHGTHGASVLLNVTQDTDIEVYVAQVFHGRSEQLKHNNILEDRSIWAIDKAIRHSVTKWGVDIISMSFGFPDEVDEISKAIKVARNNDVLLLAAASNCGGNDSRSWPACDERVVSIYATKPDGNKYQKNPTPVAGLNFATLGTSVSAIWPPYEDGVQEWVHKSGTSTATPIAAGIAALVMRLMEDRKEDYLNSQRARSQNTRRIETRYNGALTKIRSPSGIGAVFQLMVGEDGKRDQYDYIAPWRLFRCEDIDHYLVQQILNAIVPPR